MFTNSPLAPTRRRFLAVAILGLLLALAEPTGVWLSTPAFAQRVPDPPVRITIETKRVTEFESRDPQRRQFGNLLFRGGLALSSTYKNFGGISSIRVRPDGQDFLAASDKGNWLRGRIQYDGNSPVGITDAEMAPILGADGRPLSRRGWYDTESLTEDGGTVYVGIERVHQIVWFDFAKDGLLARGQPLRVPPEAKTLPSNRGFEALAFVPKGMPLAGTLIALSEKGLDQDGNIRAFLIGGSSPGLFTVKRTDEFDITDAAIIPVGDLLILERKFSLLRGPAMRIRRIPLSSIQPGSVVDGATIVDADFGFQIDNMEGLSAHIGPSGEVVLTLISDDNFSSLQRTLLLQFTLVEKP